MTRAYKVGKHRRIADYEAVRARYDAGETCQEIADSLGVSRGRISQIVSDIARPGGRLPVERAKVVLNIEDVKKAILAGESASSVCRRLKLSEGMLLRELSVRELRPPKRLFHGTVARYNHDGCRCDKCREANTKYRREYRRNGGV